MLPRSRRLRADEVRIARKTATVSRFSGFMCYFKQVGSTDKHAAVVGKKHARTAVARVRARRQMYARIEKYTLPAGHYVWVATAPVTEETLDSLETYLATRVQ